MSEPTPSKFDEEAYDALSEKEKRRATFEAARGLVPEFRPFEDDQTEALREAEESAAQTEEALETRERPVVVTGSTVSPVPDTEIRTQKENDTRKIFDALREEAELSDLDRENAVRNRVAEAQSRWQGEMEVLSDKLELPLEAFGDSRNPGDGVRLAIEVAKRNPDDDDLAHALFYFQNELNIGDQGILTAQNYARKLQNFGLAEDKDRVRVNEALAAGEDPLVAGIPRVGSTVLVDLPIDYTSEQYATDMRKIAHAVYNRVSDSKQFKQVAKDYTALLQYPDVVLEFAGNDPTRAENAIRHGEVARDAARKFGKDVPFDYIPLSGRSGTSFDQDAFKLTAYMTEYIRQLNETGEEPDTASIMKEFENSAMMLEQDIRSAGIPIYVQDPAGKIQAMSRRAREAEKAAEALEQMVLSDKTREAIEDVIEGQSNQLGLQSVYVANPIARDLRNKALKTYLETAESFGQFFGTIRKLPVVIEQQVTPAEARSGYILMNDKQVRVAEDRFVEMIAGRNSVSSYADYVLQLSGLEASAKPYALALTDLLEKYPDEPLDGIVNRHTIEAKNLYYDYVGSEEVILDRAVTDTQLAEMMLTVGRAMEISKDAPVGLSTLHSIDEFLGAYGVLPPPEEDTRPIKGDIRRGVRMARQGVDTVVGAAAVLAVATRDPTDVFNAFGILAGRGTKAAATSPLIKRAFATQRAASDAMERSVLDGIPEAAEQLKKDGDEAFAFYEEGMSVEEVLKGVREADTALVQEGKTPIVFDALMTGGQKTQTANGLEAVLHAVTEEVHAVVDAQVVDTKPVYTLADSLKSNFLRMQQKAQEAHDAAVGEIAGFAFEKTRREAYDGALELFTQAVLKVGDAKATLAALDARIAALKNVVEVSGRRVANLKKAAIKNPEAAKERLSQALGLLLDKDEITAKTLETVTVYLGGLDEFRGLGLVDIQKKLRAQGESAERLADSLLEKFKAGYNLAPEAKKAKPRRAKVQKQEAAIIGERTTDVGRESIEQLERTRRVKQQLLDEVGQELVDARKGLDEAADAIVELSPPRALRQKTAAAKQGKAGPELIFDAEGNLVKGQRAAPEPKVSKKTGKTTQPKPLREKLRQKHDELEQVSDLRSRRKRARTAAKTREVAGKERITGVRGDKALDVSLSRAEASRELNEVLVQATQRNLDLVNETIHARLDGLVSTLRKTRQLREFRRNPSDAFRRLLGRPVSSRDEIRAAAELESALDKFSRGVYGDTPLVEVLRSLTDPTRQARFEVLWGDSKRAHDAFFDGTDEAMADLNTFLAANRYWFDAGSAAGRQTQTWGQSVAMLGDPRTWLLETNRAIRGITDPYAFKRFQRQLQQLLTQTPFNPLSATPTTKLLRTLNEQAGRYDSAVRADLDALDDAVLLAGSRENLSSIDAIKLQNKARKAYITRDWDAFLTDPQLKGIVTVSESGQGARTKGVTEQVEGILPRFGFEVILGDTSRPLRMLSSPDSLMSEVVDHLFNLRAVWKNRLEFLRKGSAEEVGDFVVTLIKSQMKEDNEPANTGKAVRQFVEDLAALDDTDLLFNPGKAGARGQYARLQEILHGERYNAQGMRLFVLDRGTKGSIGKTKVGYNRTRTEEMDPLQVERLEGRIARDEALALMTLSRATGYLRALKGLSKAAAGVTAADARQVSRVLARGAPDAKKGYAGMAEEMFTLRAFEGGPEDVGTHVYVYDDLLEASTNVGEFIATKAKKRDRETKDFAKNMALREASGVRRPTITVTETVGKGVDVELLDPKFTGAPRYVVLNTGEELPEGVVRVQREGSDRTRLINRNELRTVPVALNATHSVEALAKLGFTRSLGQKDLQNGMQRLMLLVSNSDTPRFLIKKQLDTLARNLTSVQKDFNIVLQESVNVNTEYSQVLLGLNSAFNMAAGLIGVTILYGEGFLRKVHSSARGSKNMLEDSMSTYQVSGTRRATGELLTGMRFLTKQAARGRFFTPASFLTRFFTAGARAGLATGQAGLDALGQKVPLVEHFQTAMGDLTTSASQAMYPLRKRLPTDPELLLNGPLDHLETADPKAIYAYGGTRIMRTGTDSKSVAMTNGEVLDELVGSGVYDTFHSQARDALMYDALRNLRQRSPRVGSRKQRAKSKGFLRLMEFLEDGEMTPATADYAKRSVLAYEEQLSRLVDDLGSEQRAWLYLDARVRGATRDQAHDVLNMNLLNWSEPSLFSKTWASSLFLYSRARFQAFKQSARIWARFLDGDTDALRPYMAYRRLKERVLPYVAEQYAGTDPPDDPEKRAEYELTLDLLQETQRDYQEPYMYLVSRPWTERQKLELQLLSPNLPLLGENFHVPQRGLDEELVIPFKIMDALAYTVTYATYPTIQDNFKPGRNTKSVRDSLSEFVVDAVNPLYRQGLQKNERYIRPGEESFAKLGARLSGGLLVQTDETTIEGQQVPLTADPQDFARERAPAAKVGPGKLSAYEPALGPIVYNNMFTLYTMTRLADSYQAFLRGKSLEDASLVLPILEPWLKDEDIFTEYKENPPAFIRANVRNGNILKFHERAVQLAKVHLGVVLEMSKAMSTTTVREDSIKYDVQAEMDAVLRESIDEILGQGRRNALAEAREETRAQLNEEE
jgi:hypothetical protein